MLITRRTTRIRRKRMVYNWSDYIDESVLTEFEAWYKAQTGEAGSTT